MNSGGYSDGYTLGNSSETTMTFTGGSITTPNATTGRSTLTLSTSGGTVTFAVYVIDTNRMFILMTGAVEKAQSGDMRTQQQSSYSGANLSGNFGLYWQGYGYENGGIAGYGTTVLQGTGDGAGNFTINQSYDDNNGTYASGKEVGGPIPVNFDSSNPGRVWFSPGGGMIYMYFFNTNNAFFLMLNGGTPSSLDTGWLEPQSQTTFTDAALAGNYLFGQMPLMISTMNGTVREWDFDNAGNITGTQTNAGPGAFMYDMPVTGTTYAWLSTTNGTFSATNRSCAVISATRAVCIGNTTPTPGVIILQQ